MQLHFFQQQNELWFCMFLIFFAVEKHCVLYRSTWPLFQLYPCIPHNAVTHSVVQHAQCDAGCYFRWWRNRLGKRKTRSSILHDGSPHYSVLFMWSAACYSYINGITYPEVPSVLRFYSAQTLLAINIISAQYKGFPRQGCSERGWCFVHAMVWLRSISIFCAADIVWQ